MDYTALYRKRQKFFYSSLEPHGSWNEAETVLKLLKNVRMCEMLRKDIAEWSLSQNFQIIFNGWVAILQIYVRIFGNLFSMEVRDAAETPESELTEVQHNPQSCIVL
jgi:hypothetical protein